VKHSWVLADVVNWGLGTLFAPSHYLFYKDCSCGWRAPGGLPAKGYTHTSTLAFFYPVHLLPLPFCSATRKEDAGWAGTLVSYTTGWQAPVPAPVLPYLSTDYLPYAGAVPPGETDTSETKPRIPTPSACIRWPFLLGFGPSFFRTAAYLRSFNGRDGTLHAACCACLVPGHAPGDISRATGTGSHLHVLLLRMILPPATVSSMACCHACLPVLFYSCLNCSYFLTFSVMWTVLLLLWIPTGRTAVSRAFFAIATYLKMATSQTFYVRGVLSACLRVLILLRTFITFWCRCVWLDGSLQLLASSRG